MLTTVSYLVIKKMKTKWIIFGKTILQICFPSHNEQSLASLSQYWNVWRPFCLFYFYAKAKLIQSIFVRINFNGLYRHKISSCLKCIIKLSAVKRMPLSVRWLIRGPDKRFGIITLMFRFPVNCSLWRLLFENTTKGNVIHFSSQGRNTFQCPDISGELQRKEPHSRKQVRSFTVGSLKTWRYVWQPNASKDECATEHQTPL